MDKNMCKRIRLGLFGRIMLAMAVGIAIGFVLPEWGVRAAIVEAGRNSGKMLIATFAFVIVSVIASGYFALAVDTVTGERRMS